MSVGDDMKSLLTTAGVTASKNYLDMSVQNAVAVMETGGFSPIKCHGGHTTTTTFDRPSFQILVHNASKASANTVIDTIVTALDNRANESINGHFYQSVRMSTPPYYLGLVQTAAGETNEYSINFVTQKSR
jgi:ribosomal protein S27E